MAKKYNQPLSGFVVPRYGGLPTFMRLPYHDNPSGVEIGLIGVPWDGGTTNRAGARHGPREIRNQSSFMRRVQPGDYGKRPTTSATWLTWATPASTPST